jgi:hypothetical protein
MNCLQNQFVGDENPAGEEIVSGDGLKMDPSLLKHSSARYDVM